MKDDILLLNDQPVTCPICGSRTDFTTRPDGVQEHTCLANNQHVFLAQEEVYVQKGEPRYAHFRRPVESAITRYGSLAADLPKNVLDKLDQPTAPTHRTLNNSEKATILHGLRMIQENAKRIAFNHPQFQPQPRLTSHADCLAGCCDHFDEADELNDVQIDALCEDLNLDSVTIPDTRKTKPKLKK